MNQTQFTDWLRRRDTAARSIVAYIGDVAQFAAWFEQRTGELFAPGQITEYDVTGWRDALEKTSKPSTVNRKLSSLRLYFRFAIETGQTQTQHDPTEHVGGVEQQQLAPKALSDRDLVKILRQVHIAGNLRDVALLELLAATGLRASEVAALTVEDVTISERAGSVLVRSGKGRKRRTVPLNAKARRHLSAYLTERGDEPGGLFSARKAEVNTWWVWYTVCKYAERAGVQATPHTFRHTVATRLVRNRDVDLVTAATILGHSRLDTTAIYAQPNADDLAAAVEVLE